MNTSTNTYQKAELLANKLDRLNQHFDIVESTVNECAEYIQEIDTSSMSNSNIIVGDENILNETEVLTYLKEDFLTARQSLLDTMSNGKTVINAITNQLTVFEGDENNAELVSAYASLVKTVNEGAKLLIQMYTEIIKAHQLINKQKDEKKVTIAGDININTNNNSISGNISDIIKQMRA